MHRVTLCLLVSASFLKVSLKNQPLVDIRISFKRTTQFISDFNTMKSLFNTFKDPHQFNLICLIELKNVLVISHREHIVNILLFAVKEKSSEFGKGQSLVIYVSD
jgi:hypothetical protein